MLLTPSIETLDRLVRDLHGEENSVYTTFNVFGNFRAFYPFIGGNSAAHTLSLTDHTLFPLSYSGSPTHSANGISFNGVNQVANTGYAPGANASLGTYAVGMYNKTRATTVSYPWHFGTFDGASLFGLSINNSNMVDVAGFNDYNPGAWGTTGKNTVLEIQTGSIGRIYGNGVLLATNGALSVRSNLPILIGGRQPGIFTDIECQTFWISETIFSAAQHLAISNAISAFNTALSRG